LSKFENSEQKDSSMAKLIFLASLVTLKTDLKTIKLHQVACLQAMKW
jgi:hypothetical protein